MKETKRQPHPNQQLPEPDEMKQTIHDIKADGPAEMSEQEMEVARQEFLKAFEGHKPIITRKMLETLDQMVKLPGVVTLSKHFLNIDATPFRGKIVIHAVRMAEGEPTLQTKLQAAGNKQVKVSRPMVEVRKLVSMYDMNATSKKSQEWTDLIRRFSAVYTVLEHYINSKQQHKLVTPEDAGKIAETFDSGGNNKVGEETDETRNVSPGTDPPPVEDKTK